MFNNSSADSNKPSLFGNTQNPQNQTPNSLFAKPEATSNQPPALFSNLQNSSNQAPQSLFGLIQASSNQPSQSLFGLPLAQSNQPSTSLFINQERPLNQAPLSQLESQSNNQCHSLISNAYSQDNGSSLFPQLQNQNPTTSSNLLNGGFQNNSSQASQSPFWQQSENTALSVNTTGFLSNQQQQTSLFQNPPACQQQKPQQQIPSLFGQNQVGMLGYQSQQQPEQDARFKYCPHLFCPSQKRNYYMTQESRIQNLERTVTDLGKIVEEQNMIILSLKKSLLTVNSATSHILRCLCPNGHSLEYLSQDSPFLDTLHCDVCKQQINQRQGGTYRCQRCDFDRCENCFKIDKIY